jgi:NADH:ubiquinone oxidoreductase subunit 5 (subunit L)/multisubunit Na+/H+ antiporter MnhA subunit
MPVTAITFLIGTLSLCGIPPFACFWSKDEILANAWVKMPILGIDCVGLQLDLLRFLHVFEFIF